MGSKKRIIGKVWIVLIIGLGIQILFDPLSSILNFSGNLQARVGLPTARDKWEAQNITHYSFEIVTGINSMCIASARVEVRDGKVVQVNRKDFLETGKVSEKPLPRESWANPYYPDVFFCDYADLTFPNLFDRVGQSLEFVSRISFDAKYGFVSLVRWGSPGGRGLLSPRIWDCCSGFSIEKFQVLEE